MTGSWGRLVVGAVLLVVGMGWLFHTAGLVDFPLGALTAVALIVVGIGLVLGSRHGSHTGLIVLGAILTVGLVAGSESDRPWSVDVDRGVGFNDRVHRPQTRGDIRPYRAGAGQLTIDLTELDFDLDSATYDIEARVGAGRILVIVPREVALRVEASSGVGSIEILGDRRTSGFSVDDVYETGAYDEARPRISLDLSAGVGSIRVERGRQPRIVRVPQPIEPPPLPTFPFNDELRRG